MKRKWGNIDNKNKLDLVGRWKEGWKWKTKWWSFKI